MTSLGLVSLVSDSFHFTILLKNNHIFEDFVPYIPHAYGTFDDLVTMPVGPFDRRKKRSRCTSCSTRHLKVCPTSYSPCKTCLTYCSPTFSAPGIIHVATAIGKVSSVSIWGHSRVKPSSFWINELNRPCKVFPTHPGRMRASSHAAFLEAHPQILHPIIFTISMFLSGRTSLPANQASRAISSG